MIIGIDIDDTVALTNDALIEEAILFDKVCVKGRGIKNKDAYSFMEMFYWSVIDLDNFMKHVRNSKFFLGIEPATDAVSVVNELYADGNKIIFITKRKNNLKTKIMTKKWLKMNGFKFNKLILGAERKGDICEREGISLFIDNDLRNIYDAMDYGIDCILMGDAYNKGEKEVKRFTTWKEIEKYYNEVVKNG